jgi:hypothetical protein
MPCCANVQMNRDLEEQSDITQGYNALLRTPELLKSFTLRTELMTSLPVSSNTSTFHTAPSADVLFDSWLASSCTSMSVMGAFRFNMRLMLAGILYIS